MRHLTAARIRGLDSSLDSEAPFGPSPSIAPEGNRPLAPAWFLRNAKA